MPFPFGIVKKMGMKKSGYAPVNGLKLYYEIHGAPDAEHQFPLVLLHGGGDTIQIILGLLGRDGLLEGTFRSLIKLCQRRRPSQPRRPRATDRLQRPT